MPTVPVSLPVSAVAVSSTPVWAGCPRCHHGLHGRRHPLGRPTASPAAAARSPQASSGDHGPGRRGLYHDRDRHNGVGHPLAHNDAPRALLGLGLGLRGGSADAHSVNGQCWSNTGLLDRCISLEATRRGCRVFAWSLRAEPLQQRWRGGRRNHNVGMWEGWASVLRQRLLYMHRHGCWSLHGWSALELVE